MSWVILNSRHARNDWTDPTQRPQVRVETVGSCSLQQGILNRLHILITQTAIASRAACSAQGLHVTCFPHLVPAARTLSTHLKEPDYIGLFLSLAK